MNFLTQAIDLDAARPLIEIFHYSHTVPTGRNLFFGAFLPDGELYAVSDYGPGSNNNLARYLAGNTGLPVTRDNLTVLQRLVRKGAREQAKISMTKFLDQCHDALQEFFGIRYVASYSDPAAGHTGAIYQRNGFSHLGRTAPQQHCVDAEGKLIHDRGVNHRVRRGTLTAPEVREKLGLTLTATPPKDRWFKCIGRPRTPVETAFRIEPWLKR